MHPVRRRSDPLRRYAPDGGFRYRYAPDEGRESLEDGSRTASFALGSRDDGSPIEYLASRIEFARGAARSLSVAPKDRFTRPSRWVAATQDDSGDRVGRR